MRPGPRIKRTGESDAIRRDLSSGYPGWPKGRLVVTRRGLASTTSSWEPVPRAVSPSRRGLRSHRCGARSSDCRPTSGTQPGAKGPHTSPVELTSEAERTGRFMWRDCTHALVVSAVSPSGCKGVPGTLHSRSPVRFRVRSLSLRATTSSAEITRREKRGTGLGGLLLLVQPSGKPQVRLVTSFPSCA
jgi:hypothetical protein